MMNLDGVFLRRTTALAVVALLFCGNPTVLVDAFQATTRPMQSPSLPSSKTMFGIENPPFGVDRQRRGLFLTATTATTSKNELGGDAIQQELLRLSLSSSSINNPGDVSSVMQGNDNASRAFFPPPVAASLEVDASASTESQNRNNNRGRKRRAIQKIRQKYVSRPIESTVLRTMLYPTNVLIWKPVWKVMDIFIDRLDEDGAVVSERTSNSSAGSSSDSSEHSVMSTTEVTPVTETMPEPFPAAAIETEHEEYVISQGISTLTEPNVEIEKEVVAAITEEIEDKTVKEENPAPSPKATDDSVAAAPKGDRWAISAPGVDLSGKWELIVTNEFKKKYDKYLERLGQPRIVRSVALSAPVIGQTMEELFQTEDGESLRIRGKNVRGTWDRTLVASGTTLSEDDYTPLKSSIPTVDQELVEAEAWWEEEGKVHVSYMRGVTMYGGGSFVSRRYLEENDGDDEESVVYACDSAFEFNDPKKEPNQLTWRFRRMK